LRPANSLVISFPLHLHEDLAAKNLAPGQAHLYFHLSSLPLLVS
jgi:hypothetical protein